MIPPDVRQIYAAVRQALGGRFPLRALVDLVQAQRGRPVILGEDATLPLGISGYCVAHADADLVCVRTALDPERTLLAYLHELAHLLLGHARVPTDPDALPTYAAFVCDYQHFRARLLRATYANPHELAAESLATLLTQCVDQRAAQTRSTMLHILGYSV